MPSLPSCTPHTAFLAFVEDGEVVEGLDERFDVPEIDAESERLVDIADEPQRLIAETRVDDLSIGRLLLPRRHPSPA